MYDCWNEAYNYLKEKYGYKRMGYNCSFDNKLRKCGNTEQRKKLKQTVTEKDYNIVLNPIKEEDKIIELLMKQYYSSITVKKELYNHLISIGVIKN